MGLDDRDYMRGEHPPACTCWKCNEGKNIHKPSSNLLFKHPASITKVTCAKCGHIWLPRVAHPQRCPSCRTAAWESTPYTPPPYPETSKKIDKRRNIALLLCCILVIFLPISFFTYVLITHYKTPEIAPPSQFACAVNSNQATLSWINNRYKDPVVIKWLPSTYPLSPSEGTLLYQGPATTYTHQNLSYSQTYYYSIWTARTIKGMPQYSQITTTKAIIPQWIGLNGEPLHEIVKFGNTTIIGADNQTLELTNNPQARNVTWNELKVFLQKDQANTILYNKDSFICGDFAETLHNNAEKAGIRAAFVFIRWQGGSEYGCGLLQLLHLLNSSHACNAFMTTDRGLIYIDDTGEKDMASEDKSVLISIGKSYEPTSIFSETEWCPMGTVSEFEIQW